MSYVAMRLCAGDGFGLGRSGRLLGFRPGFSGGGCTGGLGALGVGWLGRVMPPGVMTILALYAASTLKWQPASAAAISALALIAVIALEHRWRNPVISVLGGMSLYIAGQSLLALP